ncbi:MAG: phage holin family protein [Opitutaceae bacterium]|nr:phage holin family protein [Opitutaceae bacterium]
MENESSTGFLKSLRALGDKTLGLIQARLTLLSVELQEEKLRLLQFLIWTTAALFTGVMALTFCSLALAFWLWRSSPLLAMVSLAALYLLAFVVVAIAFRRFLARQPRPFDATLQELGDDRSCLREKT